MFIKEFCVGLFLLFILSGCTQENVPLEKNKTLTYSPMKLSDTDAAIDKDDDSLVKEVKKNQPNTVALSDFQKHMLYRDYKIEK